MLLCRVKAAGVRQHGLPTWPPGEAASFSCVWADAALPAAVPLATAAAADIVYKGHCGGSVNNALHIARDASQQVGAAGSGLGAVLALRREEPAVCSALCRCRACWGRAGQGGHGRTCESPELAPIVLPSPSPPNLAAAPVCVQQRRHSQGAARPAGRAGACRQLRGRLAVQAASAPRIAERWLHHSLCPCAALLHACCAAAACAAASPSQSLPVAHAMPR